MRHADPLIERELICIKRIIADETWLEGERRHCQVSADDPIVINNICNVIQRIGAKMRHDAELPSS